MTTLKIIKPKHRVFALILLIAALSLLSACQPLKKEKSKVLLIGIDGISWNVINPLIKKGKLPNIKQLMDEGCYGVMQPSFPLNSERIWTSIVTGKTADKHGIIDRLMEEPDTGEYVCERLSPSSNLRKVKAIWNILGNNHKKVGVVNYMVTWPAERVNGVMISEGKVNIKDMDYSSKDLSWPPFSELCSKDEFESFKELKDSIFSGIEEDRFPKFMRLIEQVDNFMANFARYLLKKQTFDFFCLYLRGTDLVSHYTWKYLFPQGLDLPGEDIQKYKDLVNNYYIFCDMILGNILQAADDFDLIIICSDHGFQTKPRGDYIFTKVDYLLEICGLGKTQKINQNVILKNEPAYNYAFPKNIRIIGDLSPEEFNAVREEAKEILREIVVKETGDHLFADLQDTKFGFLIKKSERYREFDPKQHIVIKGREYETKELFTEHPNSGAHSESAVIIISGKDIYRNKKIKSATIYDITPTILYYLGLPVARDMDGKVLFEAVEEGYLEKNPVQYINTYETEDRENRVEKPIRSSDEEIIKERMRSLGYIN